jgi:eukaryotic-like serine/threonine-protein kinase
LNTPSALIGTTLGAYEIQALLGSGGMATVYQGFDRNLHRSVAVKVLASALAADPAYVDRFRQEARLIASLRHPHIAQVYAFGEHAGATYMIQELLPGPTLEQRLKELAARGERMLQQEVIATIAQLASALEAAHAIGVIHRDVKPGNALYNAQEQIVLTDFGIARSAADTSRTATAAGVVMGTPGYVAPEQAISSASLTPACDIYALGVVVFEVLTGRLPFEADTAMGIVLKHLYDPPPPPTSVRPDLPPAIDTAVLRALEKEPSARFSSAGELAQALAAAWPMPGAPAPAQTPPDIHSQATSIWTNAPNAAARSASPLTPSAAAAKSPASIAQPAAPISTAATGHRRLLLPLLGLLLGLLITGGVLVLRGGREGASTSTPSAAPAVPTAHAATSATTMVTPEMVGTAPRAIPSGTPVIQATIVPPTPLPADTTTPETTIDSGPDATTTSAHATFTFSASEASSTFECSLDGGAFAACASPQASTSLSVGSHTFAVRATDPSGNVDATPASSSWTVEAVSLDCGTTTTVSADADAWIEQNSPANNKGSDSILKVKSQGASDNFRALVRFALSASVPQGCVVESATLRLFAASQTSGRTLQALQLAGTWAEDGVTWSNQPPTTGAAATASSGSGYWEWDVTAQVQAIYDADANHGFLIRDADEGNSDAEQQFHSREKGETPPQLVIRFAVASATPIGWRFRRAASPDRAGEAVC